MQLSYTGIELSYYKTYIKRRGEKIKSGDNYIDFETTVKENQS